jgi:RHS repeat-associated protein
MITEKKPESVNEGEQGFSAPAISLPKGGGAIRGMGEKFAANPVTGTGSMTVPIATSPGRSGFGPQLALSYDSGAGNGPFGFGWTLSLPAIARKTDKGLPKYQDAAESDVFILSGAEDLVPVLVEADGEWVREVSPSRTIDGKTYRIQRYRPRIEGLFARIERWTNQGDNQDTFWRSISRDNITTWYGKTANSRIVDPADPSRIFSWLICQSHDDKGNVIEYEYKEEDSSRIDLAQAHERNRTDQTRAANRYLKHIRYGNHTPYFPDLLEDGEWPRPPDDWFFEVVFDYGEHDLDAPIPEGSGTWPCRCDPFSSYRAGFEVRTYRLCQRALMFHHFPDEDIGENCLVRSTDFTYQYEQAPTDARNPIFTFLSSVSQIGYKHREEGIYLARSLPPLEFEYTQPIIQERVESIDTESLENLPYGLDGATYRWLDMDGDGISGILTEQGDGWFYKPNLSPINTSRKDDPEVIRAQLGPLKSVVQKPAADLAAGHARFMDLAGDGQMDLVEFDGPAPGFYERSHEETWERHRVFEDLPNITWNDPNLRLVDLNGDGHADVLITENDALTWYPSLAEGGFGPAHRIPKPSDEEKGPRLVFADGTLSIYLADMAGDGLTDLVRLRNGEVCYWPNLGYGRFGAKITMDNAPRLDTPDQFDQRRVQLADIDGSGTNDIIYFGRDGVRLCFNQSGNSWSQPHPLRSFPSIDNLTVITAEDLLGNGTACLVWSSSLPADARAPMRYIDLMGGQKPHLLIKTVNNLGAETRVRYASSTKFYLQDKGDGNPWVTRLPFPVHCVEKVTVEDKWSQTVFATTYSYHHGYFDGPEREFWGFGRVEQVDMENYGTFARGNEASPYITDDRTLYQPPVKTITWFHTGAFIDRQRIINQFQEEYFPNWLDQANLSSDEDYSFSERALPEPDMPHFDLNTSEWREALRACKGMTLRQEVYELDVDALEQGRQVPVKLFTAAAHNCQIRRIQPRARNPHAVFMVTESEALTYHYEMDLSGPTVRPDPRIAHTLVLNTNQYGQPLQQAAVAYPRVRPFEREETLLTSETVNLIRQVQTELHVGYTETQYTNDVDAGDRYRLRQPCEVSTFEVKGIRPQDEDDRATSDPWDDVYFTLEELRRFRLSETYQAEGIEVETIPYHLLPDGSVPQKRLVQQERTLYFNENLIDPLSLGELNHLGLVYEIYTLALTHELLDAILGEKLEDLIEEGETYAEAVERVLLSGGYHPWEGQWWARSGIAGFAADAENHFYLSERYIDHFDQVTVLTYDPYDLYIRQTADPVDNTTSAEVFDFRVLAPARIRDQNDNLSVVAFDTLGLPVATAVMGKEGIESGDTLAGLPEDLTIDERTTFFTVDEYDETQARAWLGRATSRFLYHFGEAFAEDGSLTYGNHPACVCGILRERHVNQLSEGEESPLQAAFEYSDGMGRVLVNKSMAEPDPETEGDLIRWLASGKTILNNKGKPVKQYEPYFSDGGQRFEEPLETGVTPVMYYDALGRLVRTELPDGAYSRMEFSPWFMAAYDPNDTVLEPGNAWYARNSSGDASPESQRAAQLTRLHADTPAVTHLDSLGREGVTLAHNRRPGDSGEPVDEIYVSFTKLDAEGKPLWIRDARNNRVMQYITPPIPPENTDDPEAGYMPCYDIAGNLLFHHSMDAGDRWMLNDVTGKPLYSWDDRNNLLRTTYDPLRRPVSSELRNDDHPGWIVAGCTRYGDEPATGLPEEGEEWEFEARRRNLRGQAYRSYDQSGLVTNMGFDFKGNPLEVQRRIAQAYETDEDWRTALALPLDREPDSLLMNETFSQITQYDALNRVTRQYQWHQGPGSRVAVIEPRFNHRSLLQQQTVVLDAEKTDEAFQGGNRAVMVSDVTYNEKGQRLSIQYGNNTTTTYGYDPENFRLILLQTRRHFDGKILQELHYTCDPGGNITESIDNAQPIVFFNNFRVDAHNRYTYDALYRLIEAQGREHAGQVMHGSHDNWHDCVFRKKYHFNDAMAWRNYTEHYEYDAVGNTLCVQHRAHGDTVNSWTRQYQYARTSNRLLATGIGIEPEEHYLDTPSLEYRYDYNVHGSMISMPHLGTMTWDFTEHLHYIARTTGSLGEGVGACPYASLQAWYRYDAGRQRIRKRVEKHNGSIAERLYIGGIEIYREYNGDTEPTLERETLHIMDDKQRIAMVETRTQGDDGSIEQLVRYQIGNHLGSVSLELDVLGRVITYEEFYPYGSTSYQAVHRDIEVSAKRYRYTGLERDEETGFNYHGARYSISNLARWINTDPTGITNGQNFYQFTQNNPINLLDPNGKESAPPVNSLANEHFLSTPGMIEGTVGYMAALRGVPQGGWTAPGRIIAVTRRREVQPGQYESFMPVRNLIEGLERPAMHQRIAGQLANLETTSHLVDRSFILAVANREFGGGIFGNSRYNSLTRGGLDNFFYYQARGSQIGETRRHIGTVLLPELRRLEGETTDDRTLERIRDNITNLENLETNSSIGILRRGYLPSDFPTLESPPSTIGGQERRRIVFPAMIPGSRIIEAVGAQLAWSYDVFMSNARRISRGMPGVDIEQQLGDLSPSARRFWTMAFFGDVAIARRMLRRHLSAGRDLNTLPEAPAAGALERGTDILTARCLLSLSEAESLDIMLRWQPPDASRITTGP